MARTPKAGSSISIKRLNPAKYNPRQDLTPEDDDYKAIEASIRDFGLVQPIVWNVHTGNVVGGHQRLKILIAQGRKSLLVDREVHVVNITDDNTEKELNLALNNVGGRWDEDKLAAILTGVFGGGDEIDSDRAMRTGFTADAIRDAFAFHRLNQPHDDDTPPDGFPVQTEDTVHTESTCPKCGFQFS